MSGRQDFRTIPRIQVAAEIEDKNSTLPLDKRPTYASTFLARTLSRRLPIQGMPFNHSLQEQHSRQPSWGGLGRKEASKRQNPRRTTCKKKETRKVLKASSPSPSPVVPLPPSLPCSSSIRQSKRTSSSLTSTINAHCAGKGETSLSFY